MHGPWSPSVRESQVCDLATTECVIAQERDGHGEALAVDPQLLQTLDAYRANFTKYGSYTSLQVHYWDISAQAARPEFKTDIPELVSSKCDVIPAMQGTPATGLAVMVIPQDAEVAISACREGNRLAPCADGSDVLIDPSAYARQREFIDDASTLLQFRGSATDVGVPDLFPSPALNRARRSYSGASIVAGLVGVWLIALSRLRRRAPTVREVVSAD